MKLLSPASIEAHLNYLTDRGMSKATVRSYGSDLKLFKDWSGPVTSMDNMEDVAAQWLTAGVDKWAARTVRRRRSSIRRYALHLGAGESFLQDYRTPTPAPLEAHPLPGGLDDVIAMLETCRPKPRERALVTLCGLLGLRVSEAVDVRPSHFKLLDDDDPRRAKLAVNGKGNKVRILPVVQGVYDHLNARMVECVADDDLLVPMHVGSARRAIKRIASDTGLGANVSSHDLRMTFGTAAYRIDNDLRSVQTLLGHASPDTTAGYTAVNDEQLTTTADVGRVSGAR